MRSFEERVNERPKASSHQIILEKLRKRFPDRLLDSDDTFFDALVEYDTHLCDRYENLPHFLSVIRKWEGLFLM